MSIPFVKPILRIVCLILSVIIYVLTIVAAFGGRFNPDYFTVPAMLTLIFPYLAWLTIIFTIVWFCFKRIIPGVAGVITIIVCWGPFTTVSPFHTSHKPAPDSQTFTIMTYNMIHGWDLEDKKSSSNRTMQYILDSGCDVVCLQELKTLDDKEIPLFTPEQEDSLKKIYPYRPGDPTLDMQVLSKYPAVLEKTGDYIDEPFDKRRYTFYKLNIQGHSLTLVDVHLMSYRLTSKERKVLTDIRSVDNFMTSYREMKGDIGKKMARGFKKRKTDTEILRRAIDRVKGNLIICGDFNDVPESYAYRLLLGNDMKDAYVETGFGPLITYNRHAFWFHIDQILYRGNLKAISVKKGKIKTSDHYPLIAEFEFTK